MKTVVLGKTALSVSKACLGTMTFGSQVDAAGANRMVDYALDRGVNFFDTANVYNQGVSEEITGRALGEKRSAVVLATKVRGRMKTPSEYSGLSPESIRRAAEESLRRLGTDYIDIYYLHQPDYDVAIEETLGALDALRREGKIRFIGTSNYAAWQMAEIVAVSERRGFQRPTVAQPMYNCVARGIEQEYLPFTRHYGIANVCYNPLAGGLLSGKQSFEAGPLAGTRFDSNAMYRKRFWHAAYFDAVEALRAVAGRCEISLVDLALRWTAQRTDCVILGASKFDHLRANLTASNGDELPREALDACDAVWEKLRGPTPRYNR